MAPKPKRKKIPADPALKEASHHSPKFYGRTGHHWLPCTACGYHRGLPEQDKGSGWSLWDIAYCGQCMSALGTKLTRDDRGYRILVTEKITEAEYEKRNLARLNRYYDKRTARFLLRNTDPADRIEPCCKRPHVKLSDRRALFLDLCGSCGQQYRLGNGPYRHGAWTGQRGKGEKGVGP